MTSQASTKRGGNRRPLAVRTGAKRQPGVNTQRDFSLCPNSSRAPFVKQQRNAKICVNGCNLYCLFNI